MARLTREKDRYECRVANGCPIEEWVLEHIRDGRLVGDLCDDCPVMVYINKLADYEDMYDAAQKTAQKIIQEQFSKYAISLDESEE